MGLKVTNNAFGTLNAGISSGDTVIVLEAGQGARFPVLSAGDYFYATLIDTSNQLEIVKVTVRATDTMTVVRAQDGTSSRAYNVNDRFELRPTAALFNEKANADELDADALVTGTVAPARLGSGTADNTTFLRGDSTFQTIASPTIASTGEAQAGTNNTNFLTPLRLREGFNASGSAPVFACRAWVNFDGTTPSIRASGNVSSVTRNSNGDFTVNLTTAMPDANYSAVIATQRNNPGGAGFGALFGNTSLTQTTTTIRLQFHNFQGALENPRAYCVSIFR